MIKSFLQTIFLHTCHVCKESLDDDRILCPSCEYKIPKTNFHIHRDNPLEQLFWGRVNIVYGTSYYYMLKGSSYAKLIHGLKYKGDIKTGETLGRYLGADLKESVFNIIDEIIPIPLHPTKEKQRGFNQSLIIANGISQAMNKPVNTKALVRTANSDTQTKRSRFLRWQNVENIFSLTDITTLENKHVLLVDDVITTGATIEACCKALLEVEGIKISVASIGFAKNI